MNAPMIERPLAQFQGARPPQPDWYRELQIEPDQELRPVVDGAEIEVLVWGEKGRPGILLAHGNRAHARWWGPVAPLLARDYRVVSLSWSGMGGSQWRDEYSIDQFARELFVAADVGGLFEADTPPVFIAHSFGTRALVKAVVDRGAELSGAILVDGVVASTRRPPISEKISDPRYKTLAAALARFSLLPAQQCDNPFILDDIARASLKETPTGWGWRFDPAFYHKFEFTDEWPSVTEARCPLAVVDGENSTVLTPEEIAQQKRDMPAGTQFVVIADAGHHLMVDQPLALTEALRDLVGRWVPA